MCFRPPSIEMDEDPKCPECGADLFIGAMKCAKCGAMLRAGGPVAAKSAPPKGAPGSSDQTSFGGAKVAGQPKTVPTAPQGAPRPPIAPPPGAATAPKAPGPFAAGPPSAGSQ